MPSVSGHASGLPANARGIRSPSSPGLLPEPVEGAYVSRWERGENMPSWENLERLAEVLDVTVAWLFTDE